jgi:hypothetical protein
MKGIFEFKTQPHEALLQYRRRSLQGLLQDRSKTAANIRTYNSSPADESVRRV